MLITVSGSHDIPIIHKILCDREMDVVIISMDPDDDRIDELISIVPNEIRGTGHTIMVLPEMLTEIFPDDDDIAKMTDKPSLIFVRGSSFAGIVLIDEECMGEKGFYSAAVHELIHKFLPVIGEAPSLYEDNDDIFRIAEIRNYLFKCWPECGYYGGNASSDDYKALVEETAHTIIYGILNMCGCGCVNSTIRDIVDYLLIINDEKNRKARLKERFGVENISDSGLLQFMAYTLDSNTITDHGTSINNCWLTDEGAMVAELLDLYLKLEDHEE